MTNVTLKFTGEVWARMQKYEMKFAFEGTTLGDLLNTLFARYNLRDLVLDAHGQFAFRSGILVNGRSAKYLGVFDAPIHPGDEVIIMRPSIAAV